MAIHGLAIDSTFFITRAFSRTNGNTSCNKENLPPEGQEVCVLIQLLGTA